MSGQMKARYVGVREYYAGAPARDLTVEEYERLAPEVRRLVDEGGLYEVVGGRGMETAATESAATGEGAGLADLPMEIADALVAAGYARLADVAGASDEELLGVAGIGPARLAQIRELSGG